MRARFYTAIGHNTEYRRQIPLSTLKTVCEIFVASPFSSLSLNLIPEATPPLREIMGIVPIFSPSVPYPLALPCPIHE